MNLLHAFKNPLAALGLCLVGGWVILGIFAPWLAPHDPLESFTPLLTPFSDDGSGQTFLLGTDVLGRDILSRLIWGTRTVLLWSTLATLTAFAFGIAMGLCAGYFNGWVDSVLSYIADTVLSFPVLVLYIVIIIALGASALNILIAVTFTSAPAIFRIMRALTMDLRSRDYVLSAITQGEGALRIMTVEILPNCGGPLIVDFCLRIGYTAIMIGALGFLGLGLPPPTPDWGGMINEGRSMAIAFPHLVIFPCIAISTLMLGLSLLADGLDEHAQKGTRS
ncbi:MULTISPECIES: ABC transporter permease [unclassified Pseudomonas]|uniref:ABC transporter permease n=1 Tax=unclassified Pseudomonas TaxID=196821 RepID=UPI00128DA1C4|nr:MULTISPECIES: ABC transporter permease [unclassified Pseudomonas]MPQ66682.1 ABC transporter permease subunit [Pseudomonas sp. MWU12-2323]